MFRAKAAKKKRKHAKVYKEDYLFLCVLSYRLSALCAKKKLKMALDYL